MTAGPWKPVRLETYHARIEHVHVNYELAEDLTSVRGSFVAQTTSQSDTVQFELRLGRTTLLQIQGRVDDDGIARADFSLGQFGLTTLFRMLIQHADKPQLWFPHGCGEQPLYALETALLRDGALLDSSSIRTSFRKAELIREPDTIGESFFFRINGHDVFCGGSCWIPADSMLPRLRDEDYRAWLTTMKEGNQVMIR